MALSMTVAAVATTCLLAGCAPAMKAAGYPPNPRRTEPPPRLSEKALAVGSRAPGFALPPSTGGTWSLGNALQRGPVVIVFYRGHW
jgi:hypothetical protein